jgi:hypothetical protein
MHPTPTRVTPDCLLASLAASVAPRAWSLKLPARVAPRASVGDLGRGQRGQLSTGCCSNSQSRKMKDFQG